LKVFKKQGAKMLSCNKK